MQLLCWLKKSAANEPNPMGYIRLDQRWYSGMQRIQGSHCMITPPINKNRFKYVSKKVNRWIKKEL